MSIGEEIYQSIVLFKFAVPFSCCEMLVCLNFLEFLLFLLFEVIGFSCLILNIPIPHNLLNFFLITIFLRPWVMASNWLVLIHIIINHFLLFDLLFRWLASFIFLIAFLLLLLEGFKNLGFDDILFEIVLLGNFKVELKCFDVIKVIKVYFRHLFIFFLLFEFFNNPQEPFSCLIHFVVLLNYNSCLLLSLPSIICF